MFVVEQKFHYPDEDAKRPSVPRKDDVPAMGLKTTKNFINQVRVQHVIEATRSEVNISLHLHLYQLKLLDLNSAKLVVMLSSYPYEQSQGLHCYM